MDMTAPRSVILLPGTAGTADEWSGVAPALSAHGRLTVLELPGSGALRHLADEPGRGMSLEDVVDSLAEVIHNAEADPLVLVGHSAGGHVAALLSSRLARDSEDGTGPAVVLVDSAMPPDEAGLQAKRAPLQRIAEEGPEGPFREAMDRNLTTSLDPAVLESVRHAVDTVHPRVVAEFWPSVVASDTAAIWRQLKAPALYLRSTRPIEAEQISAVCPSASYRDLSGLGAGHYVHVEAPEQVADAVLTFLRGLPAQQQTFG